MQFSAWGTCAILQLDVPPLGHIRTGGQGHRATSTEEGREGYTLPRPDSALFTSIAS